jgi:hypothetical protein
LTAREGAEGIYQAFAEGSHTVVLERYLRAGGAMVLEKYQLDTPLTFGKPYELELRVQGATITVVLDGKVIGTKTDDLVHAGTYGVSLRNDREKTSEVQALEFMSLDSLPASQPAGTSPDRTSPNPGAAKSPYVAGQKVILWDSPEKLGSSRNDPRVKFTDGVIQLDGTSVFSSSISSRDCIFSAEILMNPEAEAPQLNIRRVSGQSYRLALNPKENYVVLQKVVGYTQETLQQWPLPRTYRPNDWVRLEIRAIGDTLTVSADGAPLGTVQKTTHNEAGGVAVFAAKNGSFRKIEFTPLDGASAEQKQAAAPIAPFIFGGHRYCLEQGKMSWEEAKTKAEALGGHLVTITSKEENDFIVEKVLKDLEPGGAMAWIGAWRATADGPWEWSTGEPFQYQAFFPDEGKDPHNSNAAGIAKRDEGAGWADYEQEPGAVAWARTHEIGAGRAIGFIVEWDSAETPASASAGPEAATKEAPFANSLGMKFVPVPIIGGPTGGQRVLFSIWETRTQDYKEFVKETHYKWPGWYGTTDAAANITWEGAQTFCTWLTERERSSGKISKSQRYRLPSDHEWSCAVGIGDREDANQPAWAKKGKIEDVYPWGSQWPPPAGAGNFAGEELRELAESGKYSWIKKVIDGYSDGYQHTSPVGSFTPNAFGLYDLAGNLSEWCEDAKDSSLRRRIIRGRSWQDSSPKVLLSSERADYAPDEVADSIGFRAVLADEPAGAAK